MVVALANLAVLLAPILGAAVSPLEPPDVVRPHARPGGFAIVGHRGASADAPENTLAAFRLAFEQGADAVEGDFRSTRDGIIVAMHDRDLARTTGDARVVEEVSSDELRALRAGNWGPWRDRGFDGERIPTLAEVLAIVPPGRGILVEIKDSPRIVEALVETLESSSVDPDRVTVISFDADVVAAVERRAPAWRTCWLVSFRNREGMWTPTVEEIVATARRIRADGVDVEAEAAVVDESFVAAVRGAGLELHVWTVNDDALARRMRDLGVDSITTDRPGALRRSLAD